MLDYLHDQHADVMCLQESAPSKQIYELFDSIFADGPQYYIDTVRASKGGGQAMTLITRFPIMRKQRIDIPSKANNASAFWVEMPPRGQREAANAVHRELPPGDDGHVGEGEE